MRRCYLVCYDVRDAKRLRRVHKVLKGFGRAWQYSIFFCVLKEIDRVRLQSELERRMNLKEDQAMIVDLGADEAKARGAVHVVGKPLPGKDGEIVVV